MQGQNAYLDDTIKSMLADNASAYQLASVVLAETPMAAGHMLDQSAAYLQIQALGAIPFMILMSSVFILRIDGKAH